MKINLNDWVSVVLTEAGAKTLNYLNNYYKTLIPNYNPHYYKKGEIYKTQLHALMNEFGNDMIMGNEPPFENCEVIYEV